MMGWQRVVVWLLLWPAGVMAAVLTQISSSTTTQHSQIKLQFDTLPRYRYFMLQQPERLVIDLAQSRYTPTALPFKHLQSNGLVKLIRTSQARNQHSIRLVFEVRQAVHCKLTTQRQARAAQLIVTLTKKAPPQALVLANSASKNPTVPVKPAKTVSKASVPVPVQLISANKGRQRMASPSTRSNKIVVAIDAGHGGKDPGAIGPRGLQEKQVTLAIAHRLARLLQQDSQFTPVLTRRTDTFVAIGQRPAIARQQQAQVLISIHADGARNCKARGASVWVLSNRRANSETGRWLEQDEKRSVLLGGGHTFVKMYDRHLIRTVLDLQFGYSQRVSYEIATHVLGELRVVSPLHKRFPEHASLKVLHAPDIPSILVETGFITHPVEGRLLATPHYQQRLAEAMYRAVKRYFKQHAQSERLQVAHVPPLRHVTTLPPEKRIASGPPPGVSLPSLVMTHVVVQGESLSKIALRYRTTYQHLQRINRLKTTQIKAGQKLRLPLQMSGIRHRNNRVERHR